MEFEELKTMWKKYDIKLDHLEKLNRRIILETLLAKPRKKLKWIKFQNIYALIVVPVILLIVTYPYLKFENLNVRFLIGCVLSMSVIVYVSYIQFKSYLVLKQVDIENDTIIESASKISNFKILYNSRWKQAIVYYPVIFSGFLLITWDRFHFNSGNIIFLVVVFIITYALNIKGPKVYQDRIQRLEKDILNLKEYIE